MSITPEQLCKSGREDGHQTALMCWCNINLFTYPQLKWIYHCPNGGFRDKREAGKLKAMGVKRGVPDIHFVCSNGFYKGLIIELKKPEEKRVNDLWAGATDEQREWLTHYHNQGYKVNVAYGWEDARDTIVAYLKQK